MSEFKDGDLVHHKIDPLKFQDQAECGAEILIRTVGYSDSIASTAMMLVEIMAAALHEDNPMWEINLESFKQLLDWVKECVLKHEECARKINEGNSMVKH